MLKYFGLGLVTLSLASASTHSASADAKMLASNPEAEAQAKIPQPKNTVLGFDNLDSAEANILALTFIWPRERSLFMYKCLYLEMPWSKLHKIGRPSGWRLTL